MFYGRGAIIAAHAAHAGGTFVTVSLIGARGGRGVSPAHGAGASAASERTGGDDACQVPGLCPLRATDGLPGCATGFVVSALRSPAGWRAPLPLSGLRSGVSASSGRAGRGTGAHQRFFGPPAGAAGRSGALSVGSASGGFAAGSEDQSDGRLAGGAAIGAGGCQLQRGAMPIPRRQPQPRCTHRSGSSHGGAECGWLFAWHAGTHAPAVSEGRGSTTAVAAG